MMKSCIQIFIMTMEFYRYIHNTMKCSHEKNCKYEFDYDTSITPKITWANLNGMKELDDEGIYMLIY